LQGNRPRGRHWARPPFRLPRRDLAPPASLSTVVILLAFAVALDVGTPHADAREPATSEGRPLPPLPPGRLDLTPYHGKVVLLDFWASWCPPCRKSFPWMKTLAATYGERGLVVVTVGVDRDSAAARAFLEKEGVTFEVVLDPKGEIARAFGLEGMPTSYLIDRRGLVRAEVVGFQPSETRKTEARIAALLEEPSAGSDGAR
jgi:thiol-disulfide isomerase/thioredoxin